MRDLTKDFSASLALVATEEETATDRVHQWAARAAKEWNARNPLETPSMKKYREAFSPPPPPSSHPVARLWRRVQAFL